MQVTISERVYSVKGLIEFLSKLPNDISVNDISVQTSNTGLAAIVDATIVAQDVCLIDCGDHAVNPGEEYPKDLLVNLHGHATD